MPDPAALSPHQLAAFAEVKRILEHECKSLRLTRTRGLTFRLPPTSAIRLIRALYEAGVRPGKGRA